MKDLIYKGSTKDIYHVSSEELLFKFSDRYSIFDYGEMPDSIEEKGSSTAKLTAKLYRDFENELSIKTHLLKNGPDTDEIIVRKFSVPRDFDSTLYYKNRPVNAFVPLEVIFRFGVPNGSSLLSRGNFHEGQIFEKPLIEFSTKLESVDRILSDFEAQNISGMNQEEFSSLKDITELIANKLKEKLDKRKLFLWDGKFEFAFGELKEDGNRSFILVDSISLDELRITMNGFPLSKEILRIIYKNSSWYNDLIKFKKLDPETFRQKVERPNSLNQKTIHLISEIYKQTQELILRDDQFDFNYNNLVQIIEELKSEYTYSW